MASSAVIVALVGLTAACGRFQPEPPGPDPIWADGASSGFIELADALRAEGLRVQRGGWVEQPFFSIDGQVMWVETDPVQVFDYPDEPTRAEESAAIDPDGRRIGSRRIAWETVPRFWAADTRIVMYAGADPLILDALTQALGPPQTQRREGQSRAGLSSP